jgi:hypothetical protein
MKQKIYITGVLTAIAVFAGAIFKINHFPGAGILITSGLVSLVLLFLPLALFDHYRSSEGSKNISLYIVTYITCFVVFTSMLFKLMHWPYAGLLLTIALPFPYVVFLPVFLKVTSKDKNFNIYNTVFVLLLLALNSVFSGLLALNVTSNKVVDSFRLSANYNIQERALAKLPAYDPGSAVNLKIDEVLKIVNDCQEMILQTDHKTEDQWEHDPGKLRHADFRGSAATVLTGAGEPLAEKLENGLKELISLMAETPGYEVLAKSAPAIFDYHNESASGESEWSKQVFNDFLGWVLIYLDGLEANLLAIKISGTY